MIIITIREVLALLYFLYCKYTWQFKKNKFLNAKLKKKISFRKNAFLPTDDYLGIFTGDHESIHRINRVQGNREIR